MTRTHKIKKSEMSVYKSKNHYFLEINNEHYDVFRSFNSKEKLLKAIRSYPLINKRKIILEIKSLDRLK